MLPPFLYTGVVSKSIPIYLIGMMGAGKSTVGVRLAARLGRDFLDTDREVERLAGRTIAEIFESEGEDHFRVLEADAVRTASDGAAVVALGGGAIAQPGMLKRLLASGEVVYLRAEPGLLLSRIGDPGSRPLLSGLDRSAQLERLQALLAERMPFYQQARIQVDAQGMVEAVVERIVEELSGDSERA